MRLSAVVQLERTSDKIGPADLICLLTLLLSSHRGSNLKPIFILIAAPLLAVATTACTTQQLSEFTYKSLQGRQREECKKLPPESERDHCLSENNTSYEEYKRQSDAVKP